jgi:DNA-binding SARP family transcriptional activator
MQRKLLALLVTNLNRPVSLDRAAEVLYGSTQPGNPARALRFHVSRLRGALEPDVPATQRTEIVRTTPNGYQLEVEPSSIDAHRFVMLANHAGTVLAGEPSKAATAAADAFALWSGDPLAEFEYDDFAQPLRTELAERRLALEEIQIEALLALGDNEGAVALLRPLTGRHPYRERLYALLMTALYRSGRQADALTTYQEAREVLLEDLGVDPGPDLADLEHQILTQAPGLLPIVSPGVAHNLPPAMSLVGRSEAGRELDRLIRQHRLVQLSGLPGVGKSALALAGAHNLVPSFLDGTIYARVDAGASTRRIIQQLGAGLSTVGAQAVDDGNVIRTIARRDMLVLLDDCHRSATSARSVIDRLLADGDRVSVLATMRTAINGLPGAVLTIDPLDPATDGIQLLDELLGDPGVDERSRDANFDPEQIARSAGGLPGSLEIAATAIRVGGLGDPSLRQFDEAILEETTAGLAEEIAADLPPLVMGLARRLASFPEGLPLDEIFQIIDPDSNPVTVLDNLSILTSTGVAVAEGSGYRIAPVLANPFERTLPDDERHTVFQRAASGLSRSPGARISSNAARVVRGLLLAGDVAAAMHLIARAGAVWWQGPDRAQFARPLSRHARVSRRPDRQGPRSHALLRYACLPGPR